MNLIGYLSSNRAEQGLDRSTSICCCIGACSQNSFAVKLLFATFIPYSNLTSGEIVKIISVVGT